jgi:hypothetical protein
LVARRDLLRVRARVRREEQMRAKLLDVGKHGAGRAAARGRAAPSDPVIP